MSSGKASSIIERMDSTPCRQGYGIDAEMETPPLPWQYDGVSVWDSSGSVHPETTTVAPFIRTPEYGYPSPRARIDFQGKTLTVPLFQKGPGYGFPDFREIFACGD